MSAQKIKNIDDFLALFPAQPRRKAGNGWLVLCPAHNDHKPSLWICPAKNQDFIADWDCQAGCTREAILNALKLTWADVRKDGNNLAHTEWRVTDSFVYELESGKEYYVIDRQENGTEKKFVAKHKVNGDYVFNLKGLTQILYKLPELREAVKAGKTILIPEGERKVDRLRELGFEATTNPFGAGKWEYSYTKELAGADVVILPDFDRPGLEFATQKAKALHGTAKRVRIVQLTDVESLKKTVGKDGVDIINWLDVGHTVDELKQLADVCPDYEPSGNGVKLRRMADVKAEAVSWLWKPYIPKGKVTLVEGDPGIGKSWASLAIATAVSLGKGLPGQEPTEPANVVIASAEDGLGDTIRPRLDAMGADISRIFAIDGALTLDETGFALLESYLERVRPALLIIDPLVAYLGASVDIHRANETRAVMSQLARLAEKFDVAILAIRHLTKGGMSKVIYRGLGSIDFTAACRSVLLAGCDTENPQNRALVHIKHNLTPAGPAIGYELREDGFHWTGESTLTALQPAIPPPRTKISVLIVVASVSSIVTIIISPYRYILPLVFVSWSILANYNQY